MDSKELVVCPFWPASGQVNNKYFIGRIDVIKAISQAVIQSSGNICNFSIVGMPRIGKSSLLKNIIPKLRTRYKFLLSPYLSLDTCKDSDDMWYHIVKLIDRELKHYFKDTEEYKQFIELLNYELDKDDIDYSYLEIYSRCLFDCGFRVILLMDEFDRFSSIALSGVTGQLRTIADSSESSIRIITASRRTIELIENETADAVQENISNLAGIFNHSVTLHPFDNNELCEYWHAVSERIGNNVSKEYRNSIEYLTGGHPCLLNLVNYDIWTAIENNDFLINGEPAQISTQLRIQIQNLFRKHIIEDLKNWNLLGTLYNITWGSTFKSSDSDIDRLKSYGLVDSTEISRINGPMHISVSEYFTNWLKVYRYDMPFDDMWDKVERSLRKLVECYCEDQYGGDSQKMRKDYINKWKGLGENIIEKKILAMESRAKKNSENYPGISTNFIDHSEPSDLPSVFLHNDWGWFGFVFGGDLKEWKRKFSEMAAMRNLMAHNNDDGLSEISIVRAKEYCQEALDRMNDF